MFKYLLAISNKKTKTTELLLIKYIKSRKLFLIESYHNDVIKNFLFSIYILYFINVSNNLLVLVFLLWIETHLCFVLSNLEY